MSIRPEDGIELYRNNNELFAEIINDSELVLSEEQAELAKKYLDCKIQEKTLQKESRTELAFIFVIGLGILIAGILLIGLLLLLKEFLIEITSLILNSLTSVTSLILNSITSIISLLVHFFIYPIILLLIFSFVLGLTLIVFKFTSENSILHHIIDKLPKPLSDFIKRPTYERKETSK